MEFHFVEHDSRAVQYRRHVSLNKLLYDIHFMCDVISLRYVDINDTNVELKVDALLRHLDLSDVKVHVGFIEVGELKKESMKSLPARENHACVCFRIRCEADVNVNH